MNKVMMLETELNTAKAELNKAQTHLESAGGHEHANADKLENEILYLVDMLTNQTSKLQ